MNLSSIKIKIIALIAGVGIILSLLLAVYSPNQAKKLGKKILETDTEFIANLLSDNLALGMQTIILDDGATLQQTLDLLDSGDTQNNNKTISNVRVYDESGNFVKGLYDDTAEKGQAKRVAAITIEERKEYFKVWTPMRDSDKNIVGYVEIDFSKHFLNSQVATNSLSALTIALIVLVTTLVLAILLSKSVTSTIRKVTLGMQDIAQGDADLTRHLKIHTKDEVSDLAQWFNTFLDRLHNIIAQVKSTTEEVASAANEISSTSANLAMGTEKQTSLTSEAEASVQEMSAAIHENSQSAAHTAEISKQAKEKAQEGAAAMQETRHGMEEIVVSTEKTGHIVNSLSKRTDEIGEIIQVIDDIADQTNLLALNAAIEAARAGEQGRGFAVVADEVRKLAERTTKATGKIAETIRAIQGDTEQASKSMSEASEMVNKGKDAATKTEHVLGEIVSAVTQAMDMIGQIATATEEMSSGTEQISQNVASISTVTNESATGAGQMATTAEQLTRQTESLRNLVNQFKLREDGSKQFGTATHNGGLSDLAVNAHGRVGESVSTN